MTNLFAAAAKTAVAPKPKAKKTDKAEIKIAGIENYATVVSLMKNLDAVKGTLESEIKEEMRRHFTAAAPGKRPENFRGVEGNASASCEMRKRTVASVLTDYEIEALTKDNVPVEKVVITPERYIINPAFMNDQALLAKVSAALQKIAGLPEDFIQMQAEVSKTVVSDLTFDKICEKGLLGRHFDAVATLAIKPKMDKEPDVAKVIEAAKKLLVV